MLDTWFSSALWPFSTLGWPEKTAEVDRYYPGDVLVTGFDIIFFWVARMMMMGLHMMGDVPFRTVYIHGLVRDEKGQKMSKSRGNVIDPLELIDSYGADALRFTICALTGPGRDVKLSASRVESYRGFVTKLWNAARFCEMNADAARRGVRSGGGAAAAVALAAGCRPTPRSPRRPRRWKLTVSTNTPPPDIVSSGIHSATGSWNSPNRCWPRARIPPIPRKSAASAPTCWA